MNPMLQVPTVFLEQVQGKDLGCGLAGSNALYWDGRDGSKNGL